MNATSSTSEKHIAKPERLSTANTIADLHLDAEWETRLIQWVLGGDRKRYMRLSDEERAAIRKHAKTLTIQTVIEVVTEWRAAHRERGHHNVPTAFLEFERALQEGGLLRGHIRYD